MKTRNYGSASYTLLDSSLVAEDCLPELRKAAVESYFEKRANLSPPESMFSAGDLPKDGIFKLVQGVQQGEVLYGCEMEDGSYQYEMQYYPGERDKAWMREREENYCDHFESTGALQILEPDIWLQRIKEKVSKAIDPEAANVNLNLNGMALTIAHIQILSEILTDSQILQTLDLRDVELTVEMLYLLLKAVNFKRNLSRIILNIDHIKKVASIIIDGDYFKVLSLSGLVLTPEMLGILLKAISGNPKVISLDLSNFNLTLDHLYILAQFIASNPTLESLNLSQIQLTFEMGGILLEAVKTNYTLTHIELDFGFEKALFMQLQSLLWRNLSHVTERHIREAAHKTDLSKPNTEIKIEELYRCGICNKIMLYPVVAADGETYEREEIERWFKKYDTSPKTKQPLHINLDGTPNKSLLPNNTIQRQIRNFLGFHPELWCTEEIYVSERLMQNLVKAVHNKDLQAIKEIVTIDQRFLTRPLTEGQHLLSLALHSSAEILEHILALLGDKFWELPEVIDDAGASFFRIAATNLGVLGARIIAAKLEWQQASVQKQFHVSIENNGATLAAVCLDLGADLEEQDINGARPLHLVINTGKYELARLFIERRADLQALDRDGYTALHLAATRGDVSAAQSILEARRTYNFIDIQNPKKRLSALHIALDSLQDQPNNPIRFAMVELLVNAEADLEIPNAQGDTAILQAINMNHIQLFDLLLCRQISPVNKEARDRNGHRFTALHLVVELGRVEFMQRLLQTDVDMEALSLPEKDTVVLHAIRSNKPELLALILAHKPKPNLEAVDSAGNTPLHLAFYLGYMELVSQLVNAGADLEKTDKDGNPALLRAVAAQRLDLVRQMFERPEHPAQPDAINAKEENALHIVAQQKEDAVPNHDMALFLLEQGVSGISLDKEGNTPIHAACKLCHRKMAELINRKSFDIAVQQRCTQSSTSSFFTSRLSISGSGTPTEETIHSADLQYGPYLGAGSYAKVYRGVWHGHNVAIKQLIVQGLSPQAEEELVHEASVMRQLRHTNVLPLLGICIEPGNYILVTKYMAHGSLYNMLQSSAELTWTTRWDIALGISRGIEHLHNHAPRILHGDLKSSNVLLDENNIPRIADFGLSKVKVETDILSGRRGVAPAPIGQNAVGAVTATGALPWMAPELINNLVAEYSSACDVFSFGVIMWELSSRQIPWHSANRTPTVDQIRAAILKGEREKIPQDTPPSYAKLITGFWAQNPNDRPSIDIAVRTLEEKRCEVTTKIEESFTCPITCEIMRDPVIDPAGHSFEREAVLNWLEKSNTCPYGCETLNKKELIPNIALRDAIESFLRRNQHLVSQPANSDSVSTASPGV